MSEPLPRSLRLRIHAMDGTTIAADGVMSIRAADRTGSFGIWPGHADFLTVLDVGVVSYRLAEGPWAFCAVRRGILRAHGGSQVEVATREAVAGTDLQQLDQHVLAVLSRRQADEDEARREARRLHAQALLELVRPLKPARSPWSY